MDLGLRNKVALISGGTQGIGFAAAQQLYREGARVALFSRTQDNVHAALEKLGDDEDRIRGYVCDLSDESGVNTMLSSLRAAWGEIDIFVGSSGGPSFGQAQSLSENELVKALHSNFISLATLTNKLVPDMKIKQWGRVVFVTTSGVIQPVPNLALSNVSRSALTSFVKTLAIELASEGITVNTVIPGRIHTERLQEVLTQEAGKRGVTYEEIVHDNMHDIPAGRYGNPEEMAALITFLCSDAASYITGVKIPVDGGMIKSV